MPLAAIGPFALYELDRPVRAALAGVAGQGLSALCPLRQRLHRDQPAERHHLRAEPPHGADDGLRLLAADALFRVHPAVDPAARFLAVAVDRRRRGRAAVPAGPVAHPARSRSATVARALRCSIHLSRSIVLLAAGVDRRHRGRQPAPAVRQVGRRRRRARPRHQHVRPARLAGRGRPPAGLAQPIRRARCARSACCSSTSGASPP